MDKNSLRHAMLRRREALTHSFVSKSSREIYERITCLPQWSSGEAVMMYVASKNEVMTGSIAGWLMYKGNTVCLPIVDGSEIRPVKYNGTSLHPGQFGIPVPNEDSMIPVSPESLSIIVCPGVAFSEDLSRVGFGRGYYDRLLTRAPQAIKIGLAYDFQIAESIDTDEHDIDMDIIVTPSRVIQR